MAATLARPSLVMYAEVGPYLSGLRSLLEEVSCAGSQVRELVETALGLAGYELKDWPAGRELPVISSGVMWRGYIARVSVLVFVYGGEIYINFPEFRLP